MQQEYLERLSGPVQEFIREVEARSGTYINVILDPNLNQGDLAGRDIWKLLLTPDAFNCVRPPTDIFLTEQ